MINTPDGQPSLQRAILIIGPSQAGKSTFGNFLVSDPERFPTGDGTSAVTKDVSVSPIPDTHFLVIDTPGLMTEHNDECTKNFYRYLQKIPENTVLSLIVVVARFGQLIGTTYKKLITYYSSLFQNFLRTNICLVISDVQFHDCKWIRQRGGVQKVNETLKVTQNSIKDLLQVDDLQTFCIDCLGDDFDLEEAYKVRELILEKANTMPGISKQEVVYIKSMEQSEKDSLKVQELKGRLKGIEDGVEIYDKDMVLELRKLSFIDSNESENEDVQFTTVSGPLECKQDEVILLYKQSLPKLNLLRQELHTAELRELTSKNNLHSTGLKSFQDYG